METITIKRNKNNYYKKFDDYENTYSRITKKEFYESLESARENGRIIHEWEQVDDIPLAKKYGIKIYDNQTACYIN